MEVEWLSTPSFLLELSDDEQRVIFELLGDALRPTVALNFSATCRRLRQVSEAPRKLLQQRRGLVVALCSRVRMSFVEVSGANELLWYSQGLTMANTSILGTLMSTNVLPRLEVLNLSCNRIGAKGMQALCETLGHGTLPRLRSFDLTGNVLGLEGAAALAAALSRGALQQLEALKLGRNYIGDRGLIALAPPLRRLSRLKELQLFSNQIGDQGLDALLANLDQKQLKRLQSLNLISNRISDVGCATLIAALDGRALPPLVLPPLSVLSIDDNPWMSEAAKKAALDRTAPRPTTPARLTRICEACGRTCEASAVREGLACPNACLSVTLVD